MVNNFDKFRNWMNFTDENDFYFVQILKRRKDQVDKTMKRDSKLIRSFYIKSIEDFNECIPKIVELCETNRARAMVRLNIRNFRYLHLKMMKKLIEIQEKNGYQNIHRVFESVAGKYNSERLKTWLIDVDEPYNQEIVDDIRNKLGLLRPAGDKIKEVFPSKNGFSVITKPFDLTTMRNQGIEWDIHKDNPVNLYIPKSLDIF